MDIIRTYMFRNLSDIDYFPLMERWLHTIHVPEVLSQMDPLLGRYVSYLAAPTPAGAETNFGVYNHRMMEFWWHNEPAMPKGPLTLRTMEDHEKIVGGGHGDLWAGKKGGPNPPVMVNLPNHLTDDFKGKGLTLDDGAILRWVTAIKYPVEVSLEEAEDWYIHVHAPEVCDQPGLKRFFSTKALMAEPGSWVRVSEQWYQSASEWRKAVLESPPLYTKPSWAKYDQYPYLEPYADFVSMFLLEAPTNDYKKRQGLYLTTGAWHMKADD